jgi:hypothetical protein
MRRRPTLPLVGSTIGAEMLNDRVRKGNGWDHLAVITSSKTGYDEVQRQIQEQEKQKGRKSLSYH